MSKHFKQNRPIVLTKPIIAMVVGDADYSYTGGRVIRLLKRAAHQLQCSFQAVVNDASIAKEIKI